VIGAGIAGISTAYHLAKEGLKVVVVEQAQVASGATGRNAGFILAGLAERYVRAVAIFGRGRTKELWSCTEDNHRRMAAFIDSNGLECGYRQGGSQQVGSDALEATELEESAAMMHDDGFAVRYQSNPPPPLDGTDYQGCLTIDGDGEIDPVRFVRGAASIIEAQGVTIVEDSPVQHIDASQLGTCVVNTAHASVRAHIGVLTTNAWCGDLVPELTNLIVPTRGQMLATAPCPPLFERPIYANHGFEYWRQLNDGRIVLGGWRYLDEDGERGTSEEVSAPIHDAMNGFLDRFAALRDVTITHRWSGPMGFARDGLPLIGPTPGHPSLLMAAGFTGHGFGWGWYSGALIRDWIIDGKPSVATSLTPKRFLDAT